MESEDPRPLHGIEIAQRFLQTKVGMTTAMYEQAMYKTDPVKYTVLVLRDMARLNLIKCDSKMELFGT